MNDYTSADTEATGATETEVDTSTANLDPFAVLLGN